MQNAQTGGFEAIIGCSRVIQNKEIHLEILSLSLQDLIHSPGLNFFCGLLMEIEFICKVNLD